jgi:proteasome lid subunit RPN8/RPN11
MLRGDHEQAIVAHLEAEYPREAVGVILARPDRGMDFPAADRVLLACRNAHPDPYNHFALDPADYAAMLPRLAAGYTLELVYHSHPDRPAGLSADDRAAAAGNASAVHLVAAVPGGRVAALRAYRLLEGDWVEVWAKDVAQERGVRAAQDALARAASEAVVAAQGVQA